MSSYLHHRGLAAYPVPKLLATHVVFGSPSKKCRGSGICELYMLHAPEGKEHPCAAVEAELLLAEWCLALLVSTRQVPALHLEGGNFILEEDFFLPTWLNKFHHTAPRYIPAGAYPFQRINKSMYIEFPLFVCP